jgi:hypothetical protein
MKLMKRSSLAIFANFFIDNDERLQRMKDSFHSFKGSNPNQWVINIRGQLKHQAGDFLKNEIGKKLKLSYLQSRRGWFYDSKIIASKIYANYILFWIEDHILISTPEILNNCVAEMSEFNVDQLWYSFLTKEIKARFNILKTHKKGRYITVTKLDYESCSKIRNKLKNDFYTVSAVSIMNKNFFMKVLTSHKPYLKRWPRHLPFDFEKKSSDKISSLIWHSLPNQELFVAIDDDRDEIGYSLMSRGLYPNRIDRNYLKILEYKNSFKWKIKIKIFFSGKYMKYFLPMLHYINRIYNTLNLIFNK